VRGSARTLAAAAARIAPRAAALERMRHLYAVRH